MKYCFNSQSCPLTAPPDLKRRYYGCQVLMLCVTSTFLICLQLDIPERAKHIFRALYLTALCADSTNLCVHERTHANTFPGRFVLKRYKA